MVLPPAKEERSNVLALACDGSENNVKGMYECYSLTEEDGLIMMGRYLNITRFERVKAPLPFLPDDKFPEAETLTGLLTHGKADVLLLHMVMSERRAFSTKFLFPVLYGKHTFLYPSPRVIRSSFTVLKIFSVPVWCASAASLALLVLMLRGLACGGERPVNFTRVVVTLLTPQDKETDLARSRRLSVRIVLVTLYFLCFMMWYCFTGGYISFLNLPFYEEAPDTAQKVLAVFREGRLQPCIWKNSFLNVSLVHPKSTVMSHLRDAVGDWTPFMLEDMNECAERARRRQAVFISGSWYQERYAYSLRGEVEVSSESLNGFVLMSYVLPKASPYEDLIQNAIKRMFEAGLFDQFELRYRYRNLSAPDSFPIEDFVHVLRIENTALPFCCLAVKAIWTHLVHSRWVVLDLTAQLTTSLINQTPCTFYAVTQAPQIADVNFKHTVINEPRAFAAEFLLPIRYEKFAYMFPSPRVIISRFAALRVFSIPNPFSSMIKRLHDSVPDWNPFLADSMKECVERTVRRQAVMFSSLQNLERYAYSHRGHVQISREYIHDFTPMGYVLPKASPYKEILQTMQVDRKSLAFCSVMRMFEAGLFDQFERFERYEHLPRPKNHPESSHEQVLRLRKSLLPFHCLGADNATPLVSSKLHLASVATTTMRLYNRDSAVEFMKRAYNGLLTNTKFYAISLLSQEDYLTFIFPLGYVLLGPSYAKRNNCSGLLTIAQWPKPRGATSVMLTPPAREERSNVLVLTCGDTGIHGNKAYYCNLPQEEDALPMIRRGLNITIMRMVEAGLVNQFGVQYWYRFPPAPSSFLTEDAEQPLHISDSTLQFIVLTAGLGAALVALVCEVLWDKVKKPRH
ncbi:hypothetical protein HPB49_018171 [Dermacentor silvarum]|uniref:Uncharacterized protein n=1 Tax=Dermacentor silvarum TaxID=543639 RepID=A0ACB8DEF4_DERSI|nr:hypothetical protein HPB49_018171 [Dermacentor silvarum]